MAGDDGWGGAPTVLRMILGRQLEELRTRAGLTFEQAGSALGMSHSTIRRMEAAKVARLRLPDVEKLLRTYGVASEREIESFLQLVRESNKHGWWHAYRDVVPGWFGAYLSLEQAAMHIRGYGAHCVPDLLQTEEYARALLGACHPHASTDTIERRVSLRMQRQALLSRPTPPRLWVVVDETALRRPVGRPEVMRAQIDHLIEMSELSHVTLQVMPFTNGPHPATPAGTFHLFRFKVPELADIVYLDGLTSAVYLDKDDDVHAHKEALDRLCAQASAQKRTEAFLADLRREL